MKIMVNADIKIAVVADSQHDLRKICSLDQTTNFSSSSFVLLVGCLTASFFYHIRTRNRVNHVHRQRQSLICTIHLYRAVLMHSWPLGVIVCFSWRHLAIESWFYPSMQRRDLKRDDSMNYQVSDALILWNIKKEDRGWIGWEKSRDGRSFAFRE